MKKFIVGVSGVVILGALLLLSQQVRAEDSGASSEIHSTGSESEAEKQAAEKANELAQKLLEQRREAEKQQQEAAQKAIENAREALKQKNEQDAKAEELRQEAFKKACENRSASFENRMTDMADHAGKQTTTLATITERVQAFVKDKNLTVTGYTDLLAAVQTQQKVIEGLQSTVKTNAQSLDCSEDTSAKESLTTFKSSLQQVIDALKAYKTALKNLIVAVKTAAESQEGTSNESQQ